MQFSLLGSGSRGNATLIRAARTLVMVDCGFSLKDALQRLARLAVEPESLTAVLVTHEHGDHADGVGALARRFGLPVWMTAGTWAALAPGMGAIPKLHLFSCHESFCIDELEIHPFPVPHDAREPAQFVFTDGAARVGLLTDTGSVTVHIEAQLRGCDALILECNHDRDMLLNSGYPPSLKERIGGCYGHLENAVSAALLQRLETHRLQHLVAAHLSEKNNRPALAQAALSAAVGCTPEWVQVADQQNGLAWREVTA